ncbi:hypothetical protein F5X98DRAFT_370435 [Xylaria grammica]|nr:hypothetical protein F5X98DRAFT_370435 [Xylaria grammica]
MAPRPADVYPQSTELSEYEDWSPPPPFDNFLSILGIYIGITCGLVLVVFAITRISRSIWGRFVRRSERRRAREAGEAEAPPRRPRERKRESEAYW